MNRSWRESLGSSFGVVPALSDTPWVVAATTIAIARDETVADHHRIRHRKSSGGYRFRHPLLVHCVFIERNAAFRPCSECCDVIRCLQMSYQTN